MVDWTPEAVAERFRQAARTAHRLPSAAVMGYVSFWPQIMRTPHELHVANAHFTFRVPPTPKEVEEMLETMRWIQWLDLERRKLVWMRASRTPWREIGNYFAWSVSTAQRHWRYAMLDVANRLDS